MSLIIQNNSFYYVPKGIAKFILLIFNRIKALLPLNLTRIYAGSFGSLVGIFKAVCHGYLARY